jgi:hypothetical protein
MADAFELERRAAERRAIHAELAALARRACSADLPSIALVLDLATAIDESEDWPPRSSDSAR